MRDNLIVRCWLALFAEKRDRAFRIVRADLRNPVSDCIIATKRKIRRNRVSSPHPCVIHETVLGTYLKSLLQ